MPIVIFDLEGVLIDNSERLRYALQKVNARNIDDLSPRLRAKFWRIFLDLELAHRFDKVNPAGMKVLADRSARYKIAIVSGTTKEIALDHINKIKIYSRDNNLSIRIDYIFYRRKTKEKAPIFKERIIRMLLLEDRIVEIHDDNEEVLHRAKKYGIKCYLWINLRPTLYR